MHKLEGHNLDTYWIFSSALRAVIRYGVCTVGMSVSSGLEIKETFISREDWVLRLSQLGINPDEKNEINENSTD